MGKDAHEEMIGQYGIPWSWKRRSLWKAEAGVMNPVIVGQVSLYKGTDLKDGRQVLEGELGVVGMNGSRNREKEAQGQTSFPFSSKVNRR